jgi:rhodanese-related sulfurtransferase
MKQFLRFTCLILLLSLPACGQQSSQSVDLASTELAPFSALNPAQFLEKMNTDTSVVVVDVRTADECNEGIIPGAIRVDFYQENKLQQALSSWDKTRTYLVYCRSGGRSGQTLDLMKARGYKNAYHLDGGIGAWSRSGQPVVTP